MQSVCPGASFKLSNAPNNDFHFSAYNGFFFSNFQTPCTGGVLKEKKFCFGIFLTIMYRSSVLACSKLLFFHYQHPTVIWYNLNLNKPKVKTLVLLFLNPVFDKLFKPTLEISKWYELVAFINVARSLANWKRVFITKSILLFLNFIQNLLWVSNGQMCEKYRVQPPCWSI